MWATILDDKKIMSSFSTMLESLSDKEKSVLENRVWMFWERLTLASIWRSFSPSITRERVRQIENSWINKLWRIVKNTDLALIQDRSRELMRLSWGLMTRSKLVNELIKDLNLPNSINSHVIEVVVQADFDVLKSKPRLWAETYFHFPEISKQVIESVHKEAVLILKKRKDVMQQISLYEQIKNNIGLKCSVTLINSIMEVFDDIVTWEDNLIWLEAWKILNPKTLKDKAIYVMKKDKVPMHFVTVSNKITEYLWNTVKVNTIHNELIRNEEFVLIWRWLYALKEWGFKAGTVLDVIVEWLKKKGEAMSTEEIIKYVLKVRDVKKTTIYMNLQNRKMIKRVWRNYYDLA